MRRFIILPSMVAVLLLGCDGSSRQDLVAPDPSFAKATAQEQIAALGCRAVWLDYRAGSPVAPPQDPCVPEPDGDACRAAWQAWHDWFAANRHDEGFTVEGRSIYGTEHRDIIVCNPPANPSGKVMGVKLFGGKGDDTLIGGMGDDEISGGKGCDRLRGRRGDDLVDGGPGDDGDCQFQDSEPNPWRVFPSGCYGEGGDDVLLGGPGTDFLSGGPGFDECDGGPPGESDDIGGDCDM